MTDTTSPSLLQRVKRQDDAVAWNRFVSLYGPLLLVWAEQLGLQPADAQDLAQDALVVVMKKLPEFTYDPQRRFRGWLRTIVVNRARDFLRSRRLADRAVGDEGLSHAECDSEAFWEKDYREHLLRRAMTLMQSEFEETTWKAAFLALTTDASAKDISRQLTVSEASVYQAKSRVLRRLRSELDGCWE